MMVGSIQERSLDAANGSRWKRDTLVVVSNVPAVILEGRLHIDRKYASGLDAYAQMWPGPVCCVVPEAEAPGPFAEAYDPQTLSFGAHLIRGDVSPGLPDAAMARAAVILASGDAALGISLSQAVRRAEAKLVYTIEYTFKTRSQILALEGGSLAKQAKRFLASLVLEARRRRALAAADGVQANGYPAWAAYGKWHPNGMTYLDGRVTEELFVSAEEQAQRKDRLSSGAVLRLVHSGRLEAMKGALDLIDVSRHLRARGVPFNFDIFGAGSMEEEMERRIAELGLGDVVTLHGVLPFEQLIHRLRASGDLFISCHRQSDPSCTYLETFGCGVGVVGYANAMLAPLAEASHAADVVPMADTHALAERIALLNRDRGRLTQLSSNAESFAQRHIFEGQFRLRVEHLAKTAGLTLKSG